MELIMNTACVGRCELLHRDCQRISSTVTLRSCVVVIDLIYCGLWFIVKFVLLICREKFAKIVSLTVNYFIVKELNYTIQVYDIKTRIS